MTPSYIIYLFNWLNFYIKLTEKYVSPKNMFVEQPNYIGCDEKKKKKMQTYFP